MLYLHGDTGPFALTDGVNIIPTTASWFGLYLTGTAQSNGQQVDGIFVNPTLLAIANNDTMVGLQVAGAFAPGGTTGARQIGLYVNPTFNNASGTLGGSQYGIFINPTYSINNANSYGIYVTAPNQGSTGINIGLYITAPANATANNIGLVVAGGGAQISGGLIVPTGSVNIGQFYSLLPNPGVNMPNNGFTAWRNAANTGDLFISSNTSNQLVFSGWLLGGSVSGASADSLSVVVNGVARKVPLF
jgi:hypothetical protein